MLRKTKHANALVHRSRSSRASERLARQAFCIAVWVVTAATLVDADVTISSDTVIDTVIADRIVITGNGITVDIVTGGSVDGALFDNFNFPPAGATLNVAGGIVDGDIGDAGSFNVLNLSSGDVTGNVNSVNGLTFSLSGGRMVGDIDIIPSTGSVAISGGILEGSLLLCGGLQFSGGTVTGDVTLGGAEPSFGSITGGFVAGNLSLNRAAIDVSGVLVSGNLTVSAQDVGALTITSGTVRGDLKVDSSELNVQGGTFRSTLIVDESNVAGSTVNFFGFDLAFSSERVTGVLADGEPIGTGIPFTLGHEDSRLVLHNTSSPPASLAITTQSPHPIALPTTGVSGLAVVAGDVFIGEIGVAELTVIDRGGDTKRTLALPYPLSALGSDDFVFPGRLFAVPVDATNDIVELNPQTGAEINRFAAPESTSEQNDGLAYGGGDLFFLNGLGSDLLYQLNPDTGQVLDADIFTTGSGNYQGLAVLNDRVYILDAGDADVHVFDPDTDTVISTLDIDATNPALATLTGGISGIGTPDRLLLSDGLNLYEVDPETGQASGALKIGHAGLFEADIELSSTCDTIGLSFGIAHDQAFMMPVDGFPSGISLDLNSGSGPDFANVMLNPVTAECDEARAGLLFAMVGSLTDPLSAALPPGSNQKVATIVYESSPLLIPGDTSELAFVDCLKIDVESPTAGSAVTCDGSTLAPSKSSAPVVVTEFSFSRGDCNQDGAVDISDPLTLLIFMFDQSLLVTLPTCDDACDSNDDGLMDVSDAIFALEALFLNGSAIPEPTFACGVDPTEDPIACEQFDACAF